LRGGGGAGKARVNGGEPEALEAGEVPSWQLALHQSINRVNDSSRTNWLKTLHRN